MWYDGVYRSPFSCSIIFEFYSPWKKSPTPILADCLQTPQSSLFAQSQSITTIIRTRKSTKQGGGEEDENVVWELSFQQRHDGERKTEPMCSLSSYNLCVDTQTRLQTRNKYFTPIVSMELLNIFLLCCGLKIVVCCTPINEGAKEYKKVIRISNFLSRW